MTADLGHYRAVGVAAWLHDANEDTNATPEQVAQDFGAEVARLVWAVTGEPRGAPRRVRQASIHRKVIGYGSPDAAVLKLADRLANGRASREQALAGDTGLFTMYLKEQPVFLVMLAEAGLDLGCPMAQALVQVMAPLECP